LIFLLFFLFLRISYKCCFLSISKSLILPFSFEHSPSNWRNFSDCSFWDAPFPCSIFSSSKWSSLLIASWAFNIDSDLSISNCNVWLAWYKSFVLFLNTTTSSSISPVNPFPFLFVVKYGSSTCSRFKWSKSGPPLLFLLFTIVNACSNWSMSISSSPL